MSVVLQHARQLFASKYPWKGADLPVVCERDPVAAIFFAGQDNAAAGKHEWRGEAGKDVSHI